MSFLDTIADYPTIDAFARQRVSEPTTLFDSQFTVNDAPLLWKTIGTGTATHVPAKAAMQLDVDAGETVTRQTLQYIRYQPGKSQLVLLTGVMGAATTNVTKRMGLFDDDNGLYFELTADGMYCVQRSKATGSVVNTRVAVSTGNMTWNENAQAKVAALDWTKAQIFLIDFEWLGVGRVRFGVVLDGMILYLHEFRNANNLSTVYMSTPNLPLRYQMISADTGAADDMYQICASVISEGGFEEAYGYPFATGNGTTGVAVTTRRAVLSIRPAATFNSIVNRGQIIPQELQVYVTGQPIFWELIYNATLGGSPSWAAANASSIVEKDVAGTTITGGLVLASGYLAVSGTGINARGNGASRLASRLPITLDGAGANPINLTVAATSIPGTEATVHAALDWRELY